MAERLANRFDFVYIQPLGLRKAKLADLNRAARRVFASFKERVPNKTLHVKNLIFIPIIRRGFQRLNRYLLKQQIQPLTDASTIIWVASPAKLIPHLLEELRFKALIYEMMDDYVEIQPSMKRDIIEIELWLSKNADLVITTSGALFEKAKMFNKNTVLIGNGVDYDFFSRSEFNRPADLEGMRRIVGYVGSIDNWLDFETISFLAGQRKDLDFVFVGPVKTKGLPIKSNIYFLGRRDYSSLPHYYNSFDVCFIPFKISKLTDAVNPVKLYEYFAVGKPVVASRMKELVAFEDLIYLARDKQDFLRTLEEALAEQGGHLKGKRKEVAKLNDWSLKAALLRDALSHL